MPGIKVDQRLAGLMRLAHAHGAAQVHRHDRQPFSDQFIEHLLGVQFLSKDIYFISTVPSDLRWPDVTKIGVLAVILAFLATLYPSWWAARVKPAEALRYE